MTNETTQDMTPQMDGIKPPRALFTLTVLVGSFLLFLVQPMVARMALPTLGGAPAVWNSAMLVYQALLLGGYAWAHFLGRFPVKRQVMLHGGLLLLAIICLPVHLVALTPPSGDNVFLFVPMLLIASVGPLLFAVSAQAPLMQRWFSDSAPSANPYALYAASNLGSFGGLIAYPLLVEPTMRVSWQSWSWSALYLLLVALVLLCGVTVTRLVASRPDSAAKAAVAAHPTSPRPTMRRMLTWIALSAIPSGLMLSTTTHLTTDIMAMPLMWAIPLGIYLLSFSIAFSESRRWADFCLLLAPALLLLSGGISMMSQGSGNMAIAATSMIMLFTVAVSLHSYLYHLRPETDRLTLFYLLMSVGGALGGLFCALIAPLAFDWVYEHPLLIVAAGLMLPLPPLIPWADAFKIAKSSQRIIAVVLAVAVCAIGWWLGQHWTASFTKPELIAIAAIALIGIASIGWRLPFVLSLMALMYGFGGLDTIKTSFTHDRTRSYFGVYTIREHPEIGQRTLSHGTTLHGTQLTARGQELTETSYYGPDSGVGLAFTRADQLYGPHATIGVVGLGSGTLSCYRQTGQNWHFFEIDPAMVRIARDSGRFAFFPTCARGVPIHLGDARIELGKVQAHSFDMLAIDAFSSDAIPLHMLTREAFGVFERALQPDGIALVHISNRFINLEPVLRAMQDQAGWSAMVRYDMPDMHDQQLARTGSIWVAMSRSPSAIQRLVASTRAEPNNRGVWRPLETDDAPRMWTDDYASVMPILYKPDFLP